MKVIATLSRTLLLLKLLICMTSLASRCQQTGTEIESIADGLFQKNILSKKGEHKLVRLTKDSSSSFSNYAAANIPQAEVNKVTALLFCAIAFQDEFMKRYKFKIRKHNRSRLTEVSRASSEESLPSSKIENRIPALDSSCDGWSAMGVPHSLYNCISRTRSTTGKTRTKTANDLFDLGLIDERIFNEIIKGIKDCTLKTEYEVCFFAAQRNVYYLQYQNKKAEQLALIDSLEKHRMISTHGAIELKESYNEYELKTDTEILSACNNTVVIDTTQTTDWSGYFKNQLDKMSALNPGFSYDGYSFSTDTLLDAILQHEKLMVTLRFTSKDQNYTYRFQMGIRYDSSKFDITPRDASQFFPIINKWLQNNDSLKRLIPCRLRYHDFTTFELYANEILVLATKDQIDAVSPYWLIYGESFDNTFNTKGIKKTLNALASIGLFAGLSKRSLDSTLIEIDKIFVHSTSDLLSAFPNRLVTTWTDDDEIDVALTKYCRSLGSVSHGAFNLSNIKIRIRGNPQARGSATFSFDFGGSIYKKTLVFGEDDIYGEILLLVNRSLTEREVNGRFYNCDFGNVIFLKDAQRDFLLDKFPGFLTL